VGGFEYERDRAAEFAAAGSIRKAQLLAMFDEMVAKVMQTFGSLDKSRLNEPSTEPAYYHLEHYTGIRLYAQDIKANDLIREIAG